MKSFIIAILVELGKWLVKYFMEARKRSKKAKDKIQSEVNKNAKKARQVFRNMSNRDILFHAIRKGKKRRDKNPSVGSETSDPNGQSD